LYNGNVGQIIAILRDNPHYYSIKDALKNIYGTIQPHINELQNFKFSFGNPVFGFLILLALLLLSKVWDLKKSFSYCLTVASTLYLTSIITTHMTRSIDSTTITYADIIKGIAIIIIVAITIYYIFIKGE